MGTEVLRPQDVLIEPFRFSPAPPSSYRRRNFHNPNPNLNVNFNPRSNRRTNLRSDYKSDQRKKQPSPPSAVSGRSISSDDLKVAGNHQRNHHRQQPQQRSYENNNLVMDKVTILRCGESLDSEITSSGVGEFLEMMSPVAGKSDVYAGSAFSVSPEPSSLPLPSFPRRNSKNQLAVEDSATRDLRRLLRLDL